MRNIFRLLETKNQCGNTGQHKFVLSVLTEKLCDSLIFPALIVYNYTSLC